MPVTRTPFSRTIAARKLASVSACAALCLLATAPLSAETLQGALTKAYETNPTLTGARANQTAIDENVPISISEKLPNVGAQANYTESFDQPFGGPSGRNFGLSTSISVPIYTGGAIKNGIRAAERRVDAGQANLRGTEAALFSQVVASYMDVIRDQSVVDLNRNLVRVLSVNLEATKDRFEIGDLTRTDVAQSEARLAVAESQLRQVEAQLIRSREIYAQLVGEAPVDLQTPPELPNLPTSPQSAVEVALGNNPDIESAQQQIEAAKFDVASSKASRMPRVSAVLQGSFSDALNNPTLPQQNSSGSAAIGITASIPLYQGGRPAALVRQAQARQSQAQEGLIAVERDVIAQTRASYASWQASRDVIRASQIAVNANTLSLEGVRAENSVGNRTILDILNAEQELLDSKVNLVTAQRNAYVAGFSLLAAMGRAEARDLGLDGGVLYDPDINYQRVRDKIWDWGDAPAPATVATRTIDVIAQDATTQTSAQAKPPSLNPIKK